MSKKPNPASRTGNRERSSTPREIELLERQVKRLRRGRWLWAVVGLFLGTSGARWLFTLDLDRRILELDRQKIVLELANQRHEEFSAGILQLMELKTLYEAESDEDRRALLHRQLEELEFHLEQLDPEKWQRIRLEHPLVARTAVLEPTPKEDANDVADVPSHDASNPVTPEDAVPEIVVPPPALGTRFGTLKVKWENSRAGTIGLSLTLAGETAREAAQQASESVNAFLGRFPKTGQVGVDIPPGAQGWLSDGFGLVFFPDTDSPEIARELHRAFP